MALLQGDDALADSLAGGVGADTIFGGSTNGSGGGVDLLFGAGGGDTLYGGADGDTLYGGADDDLLFGGLGDDRLYADGTDRAVSGGGGGDTAIYSTGADVVAGVADIAVERVQLLDGADVFAPSAVAGAAFGLGQLDGGNGFRLSGTQASAALGSAVGSAGDVDGDGYDDFIVSAYSHVGSASYLVFGKAGGWSADMDVATLDGTSGFRLDGGPGVNNAGVSVNSVGDVNDDGFDDFAVGAADFDGTSRAYVVFGKADGWSPTLTLSDLDGSDGFELATAHLLGQSVASAGDVNGDDIGDIVVGAPGTWPAHGAAYVILGKASGWTADVDVAALNGSDGFRIDGAVDGGGFGFSARSAGDVNNDAVDDLLIGAPYEAPHGDISGSAYVVFGKTGGWASSMSVASLDGTTGFRLDGVAADDTTGTAVSSVGDMNGDEFDDFLVSGYGANANAGRTYVVFGKAGAWAPTADLTSLTNGTTGFLLTGAAADDYSGISASGAGDVNGDGFADLIVGASDADGGGAQSGSAYVVFGKASGWAANLSLGALTGTNGFRVDGALAGDLAGQSVSAAGDVNADGFDDLLIGAIGADAEASGSGAAYVVFGSARIGLGAGVQALTVEGGGGDDTVTGQGANDTLYGGNDADTLFGAGGNDWLLGAAQADVLYGGDSADKLWGGLGDDVLFGGAGDDSLVGVTGADRMEGGAGDDYYWVEDAGDSIVEAQSIDGGTDTVWVDIADYAVGEGVERINSRVATGATISAAGDTENAIHAAGGADTLYAGNLTDSLYGAAGDDDLYGGAAGDIVYGGAGADELFGEEGSDDLWGGDAADTAIGGAGYDVLFGGAAADSLFGGADEDVLFGDAGDDRLDPGVGEGSVNGGAGADTLVLDWSASATAIVVTGAGAAGTAAAADTLWFSSIEQREIFGGTAGDLLRGGAGADVLGGGGGNDQLHAADGLDALFGGLGADQLFGGAHADTLYGGDGYDMLQGGIGDDTMSGGAGRDVYRVSAGDGADTIADFVGGGDDRVDLLGGLSVSDGLGTSTVLLAGGGSILASNGYLWQAADFI